MVIVEINIDRNKGISIPEITRLSRDKINDIHISQFNLNIYVILEKRLNNKSKIYPQE